MKTSLGIKIIVVLLAVLMDVVEDRLVDSRLVGWGLNPYESIVDDLITGLFVGAILFAVLVRFDRTRRDELARARMIAEMNHHVRNALQTIEYSNHLTRTNPQQMQAIGQAIDRIDWALREVLPGDGSEQSFRPARSRSA